MHFLFVFLREIFSEGLLKDYQVKALKLYISKAKISKNFTGIMCIHKEKDG